MAARSVWRPLLVASALTWSCGASSPSSIIQPSSNAPSIGQITPSASPIGTVVTIRGNNFASEKNVVKFGAGYIRAIESSDGTTLRFSVPDGLDMCAPEGIGPCLLGAYPPVMPGDYAVAIISHSETSNSITFTVTR
jgi:hypothetical protein